MVIVILKKYVVSGMRSVRETLYAGLSVEIPSLDKATLCWSGEFGSVPYSTI